MQACLAVTDELPHIRGERQAIELARRERWVVTRAELLGAGVSSAWIDRRVTSGWLRREHRGVYLAGGKARPNDDERERAALKACGDDAVLSHHSAAARWRIRRRWAGPVHVSVPRQRRGRRGIRVHHTRLHPRDITTKDGVRLTTVARTLVDLAALLGAEQLDTAVHEAEFLKRLRVRAVDEAIHRAGPVAGVPNLRRALRSRRPANGRIDFDLEREFHAFLRRHAFPPSEHGVAFALDGGRRTSVDVLFRDAWVAVELDGGPHRTTRNFHTDRRKDRRLEALHDLTVIRVTEEDLTDHEAELAADLWATLRRRTRG